MENIEEKEFFVIGLIGNIGSGKTTAANYITENYDCVEYTISEPLKKIALNLGFNKNEIYGTQYEKSIKNENYNISGREFLQKFGTEICREQLKKIIPDMNLGEYNNLWIKLLENNINQQLYNNYKSVVVSDIRFKDEAECVQKYPNSIIIRIVKNSSIYGNSHVSEKEQSTIKEDYKIYNNYTIENLYNEIDFILENYMKKKNKPFIIVNKKCIQTIIYNKICILYILFVLFLGFLLIFYDN